MGTWKRINLIETDEFVNGLYIEIPRWIPELTIMMKRVVDHKEHGTNEKTFFVNKEEWERIGIEAGWLKGGKVVK